jgi:release factor glutamine methyltransferase
MTWKQLIADGIAKLESERIEDARVNVEELALHVLGLHGRSALRAWNSMEVPSDDEDNFRKLLFRRIQHEPLQYILGEWEFYGLPIYCSPAALIPRPETELLVGQAIREAEQLSDEPLVLDIGTGSGAIALALADTVVDANVIGIDISPEAIQLAGRNKRRLNLENIDFQVMDMMSDAMLSEFGGRVDLLVSNPPYITLGEYEELDPELRQFEPRVALTDEGTGLRFYDRLAELAPLLLRPGGRILVELGYAASQHVVQKMTQHGIHHLRTVKDLSGILRVYVGSKPGSGQSSPQV